MTAGPFMRTPRVAPLLVLVCTLIGSGHAQAQAFLSPFIGVAERPHGCSSADAACDARAASVGAAFGNINALIGFEEDVGFSRRFFEGAALTDSNVLTLMSNVLVGPGFGMVRPYGVGGVGLMRARQQANGLTRTASELGWNIGGGVMVSRGHIGVRADLRMFRSLGEMDGIELAGADRRLEFLRATIGLVLQ